MAPKTKSHLVDQPPSASSSEEQELVEESQEEEGEEESGEETEEPKTAHPFVKRSVTQKLQYSPESGSENGSGSESGHSLPSPSASDFTVKPSVPAKAAAPSKSAAKRPQESQKEKGRKKPKIAEEEEKKSAATPRFLWSDDDQLALLKEIAEYKTVEGMEPNADMSAFHEFIRGKLLVEVSKSQLSEKLKRLKKKFLTNMKGGEEPVFMKGQDFLVFQHSKRIWGAPGTSNGVKEIVTNSTNGKAKKAVEVKKSSEPKKSAKVSKPKDDENHKEEEKQVAVKEVVKEDIVKGDQQDFQSEYPRLAASFESMAGMSTMYPNGTSFLKENMSLIATDKAKVLEEKWKKLEDDEAALMVKRLDLIAEHYRLVVDAMREYCNLLVWTHCREELEEGTEAAKFLEYYIQQTATGSYSYLKQDIALLRKRTLQNSIEDLPSREKQILLQCLRRKNLPILIVTMHPVLGLAITKRFFHNCQAFSGCT